jgi:hypothetical protein
MKIIPMTLVKEIRYLTNSMELSLSSEATSRSVSKEFPNILLSTNIHCLIHKSPPMVHILKQINPVRTIPFYLSKIYLILFCHLRLGLPSGLFLSGFPTQIL